MRNRRPTAARKLGNNEQPTGQIMQTRDGIIAAVQLNSGDDVATNLAHSGELLTQAAADGATLAVLPENFAFMGEHGSDKLAHGEDDGRGPIQDFLATTAQRLKLWVVAGTVPLAVPGDTRHVSPSCLVYDADGQRVARYDKIHLFDVDVPDSNGERYRESASLAAGPLTPLCVDTPLGRLGLSVCYDLRFPELYRRLVADGAEILSVPAAFTARTGKAHWDLLLRARAIENQAWVVAPAQCGTHPGNRATWGNSLIVDPWGEVLGRCKSGEGVVLAMLSRRRQKSLRESFPALKHRRL